MVRLGLACAASITPLVCESGGNFPQVLQKVCVSLVGLAECQRQYQEIIEVTDTMICSGREGKGTCGGDSGGPLQCLDDTDHRWTLYGLTSWAVGCAEDGFPSVATNVHSLRQWVADQIKENDSS